MYRLKIFLQLIKFTVTLPVTFLAFFGYWFAMKTADYKTVLVCLGVFLLAGAASAYNQIIESNFDSRMERTKKRPIPAGKISKKNAFITAIIITVIGSAILISFNFLCFLLGLITLTWYLGVYTLLKRKTGFAVIPGSLTGALPPLIGYAAGIGNIASHQLFFIAALVFIWQIPHFWLLMLIYGDDYKQAGYPTLFDVFTTLQVRLWTLGWIVAANLSFLLFKIYKFQSSSLFDYIIPWISLTYIGLAAYLLLFKAQKSSYRSLFHTLNISMLLILWFLVS